MPLADTRIDELVVRVPGLSRAEGHRLAALVREGLAEKAASGEVPTHVGPVHIEIQATAALPLPLLASRIVAQLTARLGLEG